MEKKLFHCTCKTRVLIWSGISHRSTCTKYVSQAKSGKTNFERDFLGTHIETSPFQKFLLGIGSGFKSITDPRRGDMVAVMGESTGTRAFEYVKSKMLESEEGRKILEEKPRISSASVDLKKLGQMPEGTLGKTYSNFLERYKYSPDERLAVRFVDDIELAYVAQRYREAHDLFHTILYMPTNMLGEVTVKWVEALQTRLPMCVTGALFGPLRLAPKVVQGRYCSHVRTYSTAADATLDERGLISGKSSQQAKHHPGRMEWKSIALPEVIEDSIVSYVERLGFSKTQVSEAKIFRDNYKHKQTAVEESKEKEILARARDKLKIKLSKSGRSEEEMNKILEDRANHVKRCVANISCKPVDYDLKKSIMYLIGRGPVEYAIVKAVLKEVAKHNPDFHPKRVCDFGSGVGTVIWATNNLWGDTIEEYCGVDISNAMGEVAASIIEPQKNKFLVKGFIQKKLLPGGDLTFDIVTSSFSLSELPKYKDRMEIVESLWRKTGKYLVIIENGSNSGFQIITEARDYILGHSEYKCRIYSPCPHESKCPLTLRKKKLNCSFSTKFKDLRIMGTNFESCVYSYVIFEKGLDQKIEEIRWPRVVSTPILGKAVTKATLCTSEGEIHTIDFSKSYYTKNKKPEVYVMARKSSRGDSLPFILKYKETTKDCGKCKKGGESDGGSREEETVETEPTQ